MGNVTTSVTITKVIPPEFEVYYVSYPPTQLESTDDGSTIMTFDISLPPRELN